MTHILRALLLQSDESVLCHHTYFNHQVLFSIITSEYFIWLLYYISVFLKDHGKKRHRSAECPFTCAILYKWILQQKRSVCEKHCLILCISLFNDKNEQDRQCTYNETLAHLHKVHMSRVYPNSLIMYELKSMLLWWFNVASNNTVYLGLYVNYPYFCPVLTKFGVSQQLSMRS